LQSGLEMRGEFGSQLGRPQRGFRGHGDFHGFRGAPQDDSSDSDGEAFAPFSTYGNTTASDA
jgi:hypothetical protein